jgi:hypothetical protein
MRQSLTVHGDTMNRTIAPLTALALLAGVISGCSRPAATGAHTTAAHQQAVKFAECMRTNGVNRFPDPDASGTLTIDSVANNGRIDTNSATFTHAMSVCRHLQPAGFTGFRRTREQQAAALRFADCVRRNGVPDFPDPGQDQPLVDTNRIPSADRPGGMTLLHAAMG